MDNNQNNDNNADEPGDRIILNVPKVDNKEEGKEPDREPIKVTIILPDELLERYSQLNANIRVVDGVGGAFGLVYDCLSDRKSAILIVWTLFLAYWTYTLGYFRGECFEN